VQTIAHRQYLAHGSYFMALEPKRISLKTGLHHISNLSNCQSISQLFYYNKICVLESTLPDSGIRIQVRNFQNEFTYPTTKKASSE
jgi:hypothetical protein